MADLAPQLSPVKQSDNIASIRRTEDRPLGSGRIVALDGPTYLTAQVALYVCDQPALEDASHPSGCSSRRIKIRLNHSYQQRIGMKSDVRNA
jgi:hypothetical protein